jgi:sugar phosphate isomerase/epimerase
MTISGLDLWIPPRHFVDPVQMDRAASAVVDACDLAAELLQLLVGSDPVISTLMPADVSSEVLARLSAEADRRGVAIADHQWPLRLASSSEGVVSGIGIGIDPAAIIASGADAVGAVVALKTPPRAARLREMTIDGNTVPGDPGGRLDVTAFAAVLSARGFQGHIVADVRGLIEPEVGARRIARRFVNRVSE